MKIKFKNLLDKIINEVYVIGETKVAFVTDDKIYLMYGSGDCCATRYLADVIGDFKLLLKNPILIAEEVFFEGTEDKDPQGGNDSWYFYKISTIKEHLTMRWNYSDSFDYGGYSTSVDLNVISKAKLKNILNKNNYKKYEIT